MTFTVDLPPAIVEQLREAATRAGQDIDEYLKSLVEDRLRLLALEALKERKPPQTLAELKPRIPPPPGSNGLDQIIGRWPGDESDAEIDAALEELS
jgi:hypothetical protein